MTVNLITVTCPSDLEGKRGGCYLTLTYNQYSRLIEETDPLGRTTRYQHHHLTSLVKQVQYPDGSVWAAQYDNKGNLIGETDPLGHTTEYLNSEDALPPHHHRLPRSNPNTCGGTTWLRSSAFRTARAKARFTATTSASIWSPSAMP